MAPAPGAGHALMRGFGSLADSTDWAPSVESVVRVQLYCTVMNLWIYDSNDETSRAARAPGPPRPGGPGAAGGAPWHQGVSESASSASLTSALRLRVGGTAGKQPYSVAPRLRGS